MERLVSGLEQSTRRVFVIMPFERGGSRNETQLTAFFTNNIKQVIERATLRHRYEVYRSGQTFDITTEIIRDLCRADIVIADLSGVEPNPNVMYELGMRLAVSEAPVILIREKKPENKRIFDIHGFYTHDYDPYDYGPLENHLIEKIGRLEAGEETYGNPVLAIVREELARLNPDLTSVPPERQRELSLLGIRAVAEHIERAYGPNGVGLAVVTQERGVLLQTQGASIALSLQSANPFEDAGIRSMAGCGSRMAELGDGTKLSIIIARALIDGCIGVMKSGVGFRDLAPHLASAVSVATNRVRMLASEATELQLRAVADTAAKGPMDMDIVTAMRMAGRDGIVSINDGALGAASVVEVINHPVFDRGAIHPNFIDDAPGGHLVMDECSVLVCLAKLSSVEDVRSILELAVETAKPLLLVAGDIEGDALSTVLVNVERKNLRCAAIKVPGRGGQAGGVVKDLAVLTGATIVDPSLGTRLDEVRQEHLGWAERVIVSADRTEILGGRGERTAIASRVDALKSAANQAAEYDRWTLLERVARLAGSIVTIRVGANTADELRDKLYRARSARSACAAAIASGCIPGGGAALLFASTGLTVLETGEEVGNATIDAVRTALKHPLRVLVPPGLSAAEIGAAAADAGPRFGYNLKTRAIEDLVASGVLDPLEIAVQAIEVAHAPRANNP
jgi:chaperonin GroEL